MPFLVTMIQLREPWAVGLAVHAVGAIGDMFRPAMRVAVTRFSPASQRAWGSLRVGAGLALVPHLTRRVQRST